MVETWIKLFNFPHLVSIKKELNSFQRIPALNSYDPGSCNNTIHGQEVLVTDKSDEDVILICVRNKGVYQWKPLDGKFTLVHLEYCLCSALLLQVLRFGLVLSQVKQSER